MNYLIFESEKFAYVRVAWTPNYAFNATPELALRSIWLTRRRALMRR